MAPKNPFKILAIIFICFAVLIALCIGSVFLLFNFLRQSSVTPAGYDKDRLVWQIKRDGSEIYNLITYNLDGELIELKLKSSNDTPLKGDYVGNCTNSVDNICILNRDLKTGKVLKASNLAVKTGSKEISDFDDYPRLIGSFIYENKLFLLTWDNTLYTYTPAEGISEYSKLNDLLIYITFYQDNVVYIDNSNDILVFDINKKEVVHTSKLAYDYNFSKVGNNHILISHTYKGIYTDFNLDTFTTHQHEYDPENIYDSSYGSWINHFHDNYFYGEFFEDENYLYNVMEGTCIKIRKADQKVVWKYEAPGFTREEIGIPSPKESKPVIYNNQIIFSDANNTIHSVNTETGKATWRVDFPKSSPYVVQYKDKLFVTYMYTRGLHILDAKTGKLIEKFIPVEIDEDDLEANTFEEPIFFGDLMVVKNQQENLYGYELK